PPWSAPSNARSEMIAARVSASSSGASNSSASLSFNRHSTAIAPCPTAGMQVSGESTSEIRWLNPRRSNPAFETTTASYSPLSTFARAGAHVPAKAAQFKVGRNMPQLRLPPQTAGSHARSLPQICDRRAHHTVADIIALADRGEHQAGRDVRRNVFYAVHRQ